MSVKRGPVKLVAMADVFEDRLNNSYDTLGGKHSQNVDVPQERKFVSFDGYKQAMDCLKPGDIVILTTPLAFRWLHFTYAIQKNLNVFMEKPLTADGPTSRQDARFGRPGFRQEPESGRGSHVPSCSSFAAIG